MPAPSESPADPPEHDPSRRRRRSFLDATGVRWDVTETPNPITGRMQLVFAAEQAMRVVRRFPPNWFELSDAELEVLSRSR